MRKNNTFPDTVSLVGMPGVGKSTVGVLLAKQLGLGFVDTDLDIQRREQATLQTLLERHGYQYLRAVEESVLLALPLSGLVVATGGSAVYSSDAVIRLQQAGPVVYLRASCETLEARVRAAPLRGIASDPALSFAALFAERTPLYERAATLSVDTEGMSPEQVATTISRQIARPPDSPVTRST